MQRFSIAILLSSLIAIGTAIAQTPPTPTPATAPTQPLEAGVQKVSLSLADLRTVGLDLKNLVKASSSLYDEVTIQPMTVMTQPEVVGYGMVINIPIRAVPTGPVEPARKERVDHAMSNIKPTVTMFKANVDAFLSGQKELDLPPTIQQQLQPNFDDWVAGVQQLSKEETSLVQLTQGPPYDQPAIAHQCALMKQSVESLDETRRGIYKVLKKHAKELSVSFVDNNEPM